MNRWKTKKKAKEAESAAARGPSIDSVHPALTPIKSSKTFRLGRKAQEPEPKLEIDIENALPSSDDFRTSLLMSGLSARFSMLREQDDPTSKIGKASDDSVLFSKRQSRLNDFTFQSHGLADIEEVSSINGSIRPPFAFGRTDSYHDGYGTDDDGSSIMNRKKPGEGNNLFGGRQKIYKIPASSVKSDRSSSGMGGRALYENDVSQSAFQKLREREKEQERELVEPAAPEEDASSRPNSPSSANYNRKRETSSTTSSAGPSNTRSSTAATSVTSQRTPSLSGSHAPVSPALDRSVAKNRRLYETGLDQALHEQQHSAMSRIDSLARQRTLGAQTPPPGGASPSGTNGFNNDRWDRQPIATKQSMPNLRGASPPPSLTPLNTFDFGVKSSSSADPKATGIASPPLSPPVSENDEFVTLPIQPNDRGKATAMGTFQKPNQPYDDNKYSQRQVQLMQQGRKTPPMLKESPPRSFNSRQQQQMQTGRSRAESNATSASDGSLSNSSTQRRFPPHERDNQSPSQTQTFVPEYSAISSGPFSKSKSDGQLGPLSNTEQDLDLSRATPKYFDPSIMSRANQRANLERPPESQHPAIRLHQPVLHVQPPNQGLSIEVKGSRAPAGSSPHPQSANSNLRTPTIAPPEDSPTLGPGTGLSGMVRQHLRSDSNTSSVYGGLPSAGLASRFPQQPDTNAQNIHSAADYAWEAENWDQRRDQEDEMNVTGRSMAKKTDSAMPPPLAVRSPSLESPEKENRKASWERELDLHHSRDGSTETQKERQDFQNELALRRRRVQENLKSLAETETRAASTIPGLDSPKDGNTPKNPGLSLLKNKSSKGSLAGRPKDAGHSKAMKMLGISNANSQGSLPPAKETHDDSAWRNEEEEMLRGVTKLSGMPAPNKAFRQARREAQRDRERQLASRHPKRDESSNNSEWKQESQAAPQDFNSNRYPPNIRTGPHDLNADSRPPPVAIAHRNPLNGDTGSGRASRSSRDRSSSDASGRSKSRNGRYRDDLAKAMAEGMSSSSHGYEDLEVPTNRLMPKSPATPGMFQQSPIPSPMLGLPNGRSRSNSKTNLAGYFESQKLQTPTMNSEIGLSPRPSPGTPGYSANPTLPLTQSASSTSLATTPTAQGFQAQQNKAPPPRKRSINKSDISEPKLISSTSRITTVNLPPGSSLQNGMEHSAPPIPPVNPRRRQTRAMFGAFIGRKDDIDEMHSLPAATQSTEEMSTFSADEGETNQPKIRQRLRKSSSEGGNLNARARQAAFAAPSPALPTSPFPPPSSSPTRPVEGGMF